MHVADLLAGLVQRPIAAVRVQVLVAGDGLVDRQAEQPPAQGGLHRGEARRGDLLEDRHHEPDAPALVPGGLGHVVAVTQVAHQRFVEPLLRVGQMKRLGVDLPAGE